MIESKETKLFNSGSVLLFSGGVDSYCTAKLYNPDVLLYMVTRDGYGDNEIANIRKMDIPQDRLVIDRRLNLTDIELPNGTVPFRNLMFALIGLCYGNQIMLSGLKGDITKDTDARFRTLFNDMVEHLVTEERDSKTFPWKAQGLKPELVMPVAHLTKTGLVREYLAKGFSPEGVQNTISCYYSGEKECGNCKACFRKAMALINNDIYQPERFARVFDWPTFMEQIRFDNQEGEVDDMISAMTKIGVI